MGWYDERSVALPESLDILIGKEVVLDTEGPMVFIGRLASYNADGFWLEQADVHNCRDGHAQREQYIAESARDGIRVNRERVFVFRRAVVGVSALADVTTD
ncbi:MAG TPA: hypothetical protein PLL20_17895 [Phycisphaerae bacterium]|nr:hypothetical protein [Phycisphaerae bacterium]HRR85001.1 hypothetical protein [Phycisphaerae bacterium]